MLDPNELNDSFVARTKSIAELTDGEVVATDGKCMRGSSDDGTGTYTHLVSMGIGEQPVARAGKGRRKEQRDYRDTPAAAHS